MERFGIGLIGLSLLCIGIMTLATWRGRAREIIKNSLSKGSIPGMESFLWVVAAFTYNCFAWISLIFGCLLVYSFMTGRDWPLHYARWQDLWPF